MAHELPLDEMTSEEKLREMERLWDNLSCSGQGIESPNWHGKILEQRRERIHSGKAKFLTLEELKKLRS